MSWEVLWDRLTLSTFSKVNKTVTFCWPPPPSSGDQNQHFSRHFLVKSTPCREYFNTLITLYHTPSGAAKSGAAILWFGVVSHISAGLCYCGPHWKINIFLEKKGEHFGLNPPSFVTVLFTFENVENVGRSLRYRGLYGLWHAAKTDRENKIHQNNIWVVHIRRLY